MMEIKIIQEWDEDFFSRMVALRNEIHRDIPTSFPESIEDYRKFFSPESVFRDFCWVGILLLQDNETVAKAILCWKRGAQKANLGFLDWVNDKNFAEVLITEIRQQARSNGIVEIKSPVDLNFFLRYRIRLPDGGKPFYGEPVFPDYYHQLFKHAGFTVIGEWDTYEVLKGKGIRDFFSKRKLLKHKKEGAHHAASNSQLKTCIRCVRLSDWVQELRIIYELFTQAYSIMPEFEAITFEQFKVIYDDFKYIINPWYSYIVELQGKPVGFSINFVDPLPLLLPYKGKKPNLLQKAWLLMRLRLNRGTYMISHIGKIPGPNGEEIKGIQIQVSKRIAVSILLMKKVLVTFQNVDSPSRRSWNPSVRRPYAKYVLYGLKLE